MLHSIYRQEQKIAIEHEMQVKGFFPINSLRNKYESVSYQ